MIEVREALKRLCGEASPLGTESVELGEAHGRVLAEELRADRDFPLGSNWNQTGCRPRGQRVEAAHRIAPCSTLHGRKTTPSKTTRTRGAWTGPTPGRRRLSASSAAGFADSDF